MRSVLFCFVLFNLKPWRPEKSGLVYFKYWKKRIGNCEFYIWWNYQEWRENKDILRQKNIKRIVLLWDIVFKTVQRKFSKQKQNDERRNLQKKKKEITIEIIRIWINTIDYLPSLCEDCKKILILSNTKT